MRVLLTGASGFVGRAVQARLLADGVHELRCAQRQAPTAPQAAVEYCLAPELGAQADWSQALAGVDAVIHCAARVHVMQEQAANPLAEFRRVNVEGTLRLACQAVAAGVRRLVFVSSIKVNGEQTPPGQPFRADDAPQACDPYGISKREAEDALLALGAESGLEVVIVRPPLIYGPGVKANFLSMLRWLNRGLPLPLGAIDNRRSLVALDNLVDLLVLCLSHPAASGQRFLVSDGEDLSTTELLRRLGQALGRPALLLPLPQAWIEAGARLLGRQSLSQRLCGSLQVNIDKTRDLLGWTPPHTVDQTLARTAAHFLESQRS
ncbi:NAD-dependent dehydratase [Pseudomonas sp. HAR-UPW-AIA-41]|uniref:UDP-glucose 4-epimerase family protein n=1 Tax=Pseudomonas sp. HAR-UPW-AIA-41 TaxID=1985301 RepID=UPI000BB3ACA3|nr:SDR family oxidoreductase [Pseudomonas sp. HAR-UPW-AIA-41]PAV49244.1 NAD-dependent dehydratase [Pseudomonas sp. HAR-UPW-AIA-41]